MESEFQVLAQFVMADLIPSPDQAGSTPEVSIIQTSRCPMLAGTRDQVVKQDSHGYTSDVFMDPTKI